MRSYHRTVDLVKEIPKMCAELTEGQSRLKSLLASLDSDLISKRQHRDSLKAEFDRKVSRVSGGGAPALELNLVL